MKEENEEENVLVVCKECQSYPCKWIRVGKEFLPSIGEFIEEQGGQDTIKNAAIHHYYYREFTSSLHGYLGPKIAVVCLNAV